MQIDFFFALFTILAASVSGVALAHVVNGDYLAATLAAVLAVPLDVLWAAYYLAAANRKVERNE